MNINKSQKTMRVLYLYLTIPLLIVTMVLTALALMSATGSKKEASQETSAPVAGSGSAAGAGSASDVPANKLNRPTIEVKQPEAKKEEASDTTAGQAAIIAAITTGITGLLGAIMQTIVAFLKAKEKRRQSEDA
jgi:hypothetical protein